MAARRIQLETCRVIEENCAAGVNLAAHSSSMLGD